MNHALNITLAVLGLAAVLYPFYRVSVKRAREKADARALAEITANRRLKAQTVLAALDHLGPCVAGLRDIPPRPVTGDVNYDGLMQCLWGYHDLAALAHSEESAQKMVDRATKLDGVIRGIAILELGST